MAEEKVVEEKSEEVKADPVVEKVEEKEEVKDAEGKLEEAKKELDAGELTEKQRDKVQDRIDSLIATIAQQNHKIEQLEKAKDGGEKKEPVYTENQLYAILSDPAQQEYHPWAIKQLIDMGITTKFKGFEKTVAEQDMKRASYEKACEEFPDVLEPNSKLWKRAEEIYREKKLANVDDGQYIAAQLADAELNKTKLNEASMTQKKLDKERAKTSLVAGGKKVVASPDAAYEKLRTEGMKAGFMSGPWMKWQAEFQKRQKK